MFKTILTSFTGKAAALSVTAYTCLASSTAFAADDAHGGEHAQSGGLPQLDTSTYTSQIFWLFVSFCLLYIVFSSRILPGISDVLERRRETISSDLETAESLREEAESVQKSYEEAIANAQSEGAELLQELQNKIRTDMDAELQAFKDTSQKQVEEAEANAQQATQKILGELESSVPELTSLIVAKLADLETKPAEAEKVVSNLIGEKAKAA